MIIVLDIAHPVQLLKQKVSKTGCFHLSLRVHFLKGPKKSRKLYLQLMRETIPLLQAYQKRLWTVTKMLIKLTA